MYRCTHTGGGSVVPPQEFEEQVEAGRLGVGHGRRRGGGGGGGDASRRRQGLLAHLAGTLQLGHAQQELAKLGRLGRVVRDGVRLQGLQHLLLAGTNLLGLLQATGVCKERGREPHSLSNRNGTASWASQGSLSMLPVLQGHRAGALQAVPSTCALGWHRHCLLNAMGASQPCQ